MLGEGPTDDINGNVPAAEKKFNIDINKAKTKFCLSLHAEIKEVYPFSVDYNAIDESEISNILKYLMIKNSINVWIY